MFLVNFKCIGFVFKNMRLIGGLLTAVILVVVTVTALGMHNLSHAKRTGVSDEANYTAMPVEEEETASPLEVRQVSVEDYLGGKLIAELDGFNDVVGINKAMSGPRGR